MAIVTATITVDFTANYAGNHRVCWRVQGSGDPYDCSTLVNCVGGATTCSAMFTADVNTTSCDGTVTFEGYVQATCQDVLSTQGRLDWTVDFVPTLVCTRNEITCDFAPINSITIEDGGYHYLIGDTVNITPVDGGNPDLSDAVITIGSVGDGIITSVSALLNAGTGYIIGDNISVNTVFGPGCFGGGAIITVDTVGGGGEILTYTVTNGGSGYTCGDFLFGGGSGVGADFSIVPGVDFEIDGAILTFIISDPGSYELIPAVTITTGTGVEFLGTVVLDNCTAWLALGDDCVGGDSISLASGLPVGVTWATCLSAGPVGTPADYTVVATGCCIPDDSTADVCFDYHIANNTGGPQTVQYTACEGDDTVTVAIPDAGEVAVCAVLNGVVDLQIPDLVITNEGIC